jgi:hypothetical protein
MKHTRGCGDLNIGIFTPSTIILKQREGEGKGGIQRPVSYSEENIEETMNMVASVHTYAIDRSMLTRPVGLISLFELGYY